MAGVPIVVFDEYNFDQTTVPDPSDALTEKLGSSSDNALDYGEVVLIPPATSSFSKWKVIACRVKDLNDNTEVKNMRFWSPLRFTGTITNHYIISKHWMPAEVLLEDYITASGWFTGDGDISSERIGPSLITLPLYQNLFNKDQDFEDTEEGPKTGEITGTTLDDAIPVSQWIYLQIEVDKDFPLGRYGVGGEGVQTFRVTFDYV